MFRLSKIVKTLSSIGFITILILSYAYIANDEQIALDTRKIWVMDIDSYFYYALGVFVLINLLFFVFEKVLLSYQGKSSSKNFTTSNVFLAWLNSFNISVNVLLSTYVLFVGFLNSDSTLNLMSYSFLLYSGPILIVVSFILLPVLYFRYK